MCMLLKKQWVRDIKNDKELAIKRMMQANVEIIGFEMMLFELIKNSNNIHLKSYQN